MTKYQTPALPWGAAFVAALLLVPVASHAAPFTLTTSGTVDSGTDTSGIFGTAGASLAGRSYRLVLSFSGLGATTITTPTDTSTGFVITGSLSATVGGATFAAPFTNSYAAFLEETPNEIYGTNTGDNAAATPEILTATNAFATATNALPVNLSTSFTYTGTAADLLGNAGQVGLNVSGPLGTAFFTATPTSVQFAVPEPASLALAASGLVPLMLLRRRR